MKIRKKFVLSFVAPFMILISTIGMISRDNTRKIFYLPIGLMGISIILEKDIRRRFDRQNILKKIRSYQKRPQEELLSTMLLDISNNQIYLLAGLAPVALVVTTE